MIAGDRRRPRLGPGLVSGLVNFGRIDAAMDGFCERMNRGRDFLAEGGMMELPDDTETVLVPHPHHVVETPREVPAWGAVARDLQPHYRVRIGVAIEELSHPLVIGRHPVPPRISTGPPPRLHTVLSRSGLVSGSHVEIRQEGSAIVVTDLHSTNGTVVTIPGTSGRLLRSGESLVVVPGSIIELAGDVVIEALPLGVGLP